MRQALLFLLIVAPAAAQVPARQSLRPDSLPPLPDTLRLYGGALSTRFDAPTLAPPPGALRLTLDEAVRIALAENPALGIAVLDVERAANDVTRGNAGFLPTLDANASFGGSRVSGGTGGNDSTGSSVGAATNAATDVTLGYTIFDGFRRDATLRRLRAQAEAAGLTAEAQAEALAFAVTTAYLDVARQEALAVALEEAVGLSEDRLRIEQAEVFIGTGAEIDAALALADLNADRAALLRQALSLVEARVTLGALLALRDPEAIAPTDTLALGPPPDVGALLAAAEIGNRRVRAFAVAEAVARESVQEVRAEFLPTVRVLAGVGLAGADRGLFPAGDPSFGTDLRYGFTATLPIFDGGERRRRVQSVEIAVRQRELATDDERLALRAAVARLAAASVGYRQLAALEEENRLVARENVRVALAQFQLGFITPIDLRQVQLAQLDAEVRLVDAVYAARQAEAELRLLAGALLPLGVERGALYDAPVGE